MHSKWRVVFNINIVVLLQIILELKSFAVDPILGKTFSDRFSKPIYLKAWRREMRTKMGLIPNQFQQMIFLIR
jgi:hypothetical protein